MSSKNILVDIMNLNKVFIGLALLLPAMTGFAVEPNAPKIAATAYILQDYQSGEVLAEQNSEQRVEPASLTKMMSAYVIEHELQQKKISMKDMVRISEKAWKMQGSRMFVEVNAQVSVEDLLKGVIIQSGNDATVALAEFVAGSEESFVSLMNAWGKKIGLTKTHFTNATGLPDPEHYTTAKDLAILVTAMIRDFPEQYVWYSEKEFVFNGIKQHNRNKLLWQDKYVDGVKTGHTESAGYCLAASALKDGMRLISVVLGTNSEDARATESQKLLTYGFRFFETHRLYEAEQQLATARVWKGEEEQLPLGLASDLWVTIPRGQYKDLKATMSLEPKIIAPVNKGQTYGSVNLDLNGKPMKTLELVALKNIAEGGFIGGIIDEVKMMLE